MYFCYIDEAGCTGALPSANSAIQPALVINGIIIDQAHIFKLTHDFLSLKKKFFPNQFTGHYLDFIKEEIKGSEIRKLIKKNRNQARFALKFIDETIKLLEKYGVSIIGRIWIKPISQPFNGKAVYTYSIQKMSDDFELFLAHKNNHGVLIADSRYKEINATVSHAIFTQKYKISGDAYGRILEMPVYGHSDNHAGIQLSDLLASAILFPIATSVYCTGYITDRTHHDPKFLKIRDMFGSRLSKLQYRYQNSTSWHGGITVSDPLGSRHSGFLFR